MLSSLARAAAWRAYYLRFILPGFLRLSQGVYGSPWWKRFIGVVGIWLGQKECDCCGRQTWRIAHMPNDFGGWLFCTECSSPGITYNDPPLTDEQWDTLIGDYTPPAWADQQLSDEEWGSLLSWYDKFDMEPRG